MKLMMFLIAHLLGDFVFQSGTLANKKKSSLWMLLLHSVIYTICFVPVAILFGTATMILYTLGLLFLTHFAIDFLRVRFDNQNGRRNSEYLFLKEQQKNVYDEAGLEKVKKQLRELRQRIITRENASFFLDQVLHLAYVFLFGLLFRSMNNLGVAFYLKATSFLAYFDIELSIRSVLVIIFAFLLNLQPASVVVKHLFNGIFRNDSEPVNLCLEEENQTGSIIGKLERTVILILGLMGQYGAIGIVIAAKSLARFRQLEDKEFSQRYLIGTLFSFLIALGTLSLIAILT